MRNPPNVLTLLTSLLGAAGCIAATSPASAQQTRPGEVMGMRYLSWSGKGEAPADGLRRSSAPASIVTTAGNSRNSAAQTIGRPSRYGAGSAGLTPASVWMGAQRAPVPAVIAPASGTPAPQIAPQPDRAAEDHAQAEYQAQVQSEYQARSQSEARAQYEAQVRAMPQPQQRIAHVAPADQPVPAQAQAQAQQQAATDASSGNDPMAPRRDALIFRMQQPGPDAPSQPAQEQEQADQQAAPHPGEIQQRVLTQPTAGRTYSGQAYAGAEPPRESARYYSVHRAGGHQPDPITMPVSVYLDNAPIDLAEPPEAPVPTRTVNGRTQSIVPNQDPALP